MTVRNPQAARAALARMRRGREALAKRGMRLRDLLGKGESLRGLAHRGHRY